MSAGETALITMEEHDVMQDAIHLSKAKQALLQKYLRGDLPHSSTESHVIARRGPGIAAPLSFGQEQIWIHAQLAADLPIYNEPLTIRRTGPLELAAL